MKKYLFYSFLFISNLSLAQTVKVNVGRTISSVNSSASKDLEILNESINTFNVAFGIDLFEKEDYYLSNEISYNQLGGKERNFNLEDPYNDYSKKWSYVGVSSAFRYKFNFSHDNFVFLGAGLKLNILTDSKDFSNTLYEDFYEMNALNVGALTEIGFMQNIGKKCRVGVVCSYVYSITPFSDSGFENKLRINPFLVNLSIGYRL